VGNGRLRDGADTRGPVPGTPSVDAGGIGHLRDVLAGGYLAILERWPRTALLVRSANEFHRRAARWAVTGGWPDFPYLRRRG
jgi:hypothetical protein